MRTITGAAAKQALVDTGVDKKVLRTLWPLADMDRDGTRAPLVGCGWSGVGGVSDPFAQACAP